MTRQYFLVGASCDNIDLTPTFLNRGTWEMGYSRKEQPAQYAIIDQMQAGDRIAIKRMVGGSNNNKMRILAIGVIKDINYETGVAYVRWAHPEYQGKRTVDIHGCLRTVHGPYTIGDGSERDWINEIFRL